MSRQDEPSQLTRSSRSPTHWAEMRVTAAQAASAHLSARKPHVIRLRHEQATEYNQKHRKHRKTPKISDYYKVNTPERAAAAYDTPVWVFQRKTGKEPAGALKAISEHLKGIGKKARANAWRRRIHLHILGALERQELILFVTLTVRPEDQNRVFDSTKPWRDWIQKARRAVQKRNAELRYVAAMEKGTKGTPHIHAIMSAAQLPEHTTRDPMRHAIDPRWEVLPIEPWPYGFEQTRPYRVSRSDPWGKMGHRWPLDRQAHKTGRLQPMQPMPAAAASCYLAKYLVKEQGEAKWQIKATHRMGMRRIHRLLQQSRTARRLILLRPSSSNRLLKTSMPSARRYAINAELTDSADTDLEARIAVTAPYEARSIWATATQLARYTPQSTGNSSTAATSAPAPDSAVAHLAALTRRETTQRLASAIQRHQPSLLAQLKAIP